MIKNAERKVYTRPAVKVFGRVANLTAAGSGVQAETGSLNNPNRHP